MKKIKLLLILVICLSLFSQTNIILKNSWLQTGYSYTLYTSQRMQDALPTLTSAPSNLDISGCISNMQSGSITNQPIFSINNSQPNGTDWMLDYHNAFTYYGFNLSLGSDVHGVCRSNPGGDYTGRYYNVSIVLNSNAGIPWNSGGNVDINTILRHEIGHLYALDEYRSLADHTLMNPYDYQLVQSLEQNDINGFRIVFEEPTTTIDGSSVIEFGNNFLYNINFPVIEYGPNLESLPPGFGFHSYLYKDEVLQSTTALIPTHVETYEDGTQLFTNSLNTTDLALGEYSIRTYSAMFWNQSGDVTLYETHNRPYSEVSFKVVANPEIQTPLPDDIEYINPNEKGAVTDTLEIKVAVPEILGSYPTINIKIDDVYVNQGDISFDSSENVWVYNWDLSALSPTEYGKRYIIKSEIDGDPTDYDVTSVYIVEAVFHEDFETITDLTTEGWVVSSYEFPVQTYTGWYIGNDETDSENQCAKSHATYSTAMAYRLYSPTFTVPTGTDVTSKLEYRLFLT